MELANEQRHVTTEGSLDFEVDYTISMDDLAHIMWVLRTGLYTAKGRAVLREYSANAWDAHQEVDKGTTPINLHIPTYTKPVFICRDYGPGLSRQGIRIFAKFGMSTKRGAKVGCLDCADLREDTLNPEAFCPECTLANERANKAVGALGIGSKAGFCIGDTFTVTSWHGGTKAVYSSAIGEDNKGKLLLMHEEPCGDETGIEIQVPVPQSMIWEFEREAHALFPYMRPQPTINIALKPVPEGTSNGYIEVTGKDQTASWVGVMGCVPYRINLEQIQDGLQAEGLWEPLQRISGAIYLPIGEVEFAANREELQYTKVTKTALLRRFKDLVQEYIDDALSTLRDEKGSGWTLRKKAKFMAHGLGFRLPKRFDGWTQKAINLWDREKEGSAPKTFSLLNQYKNTTSTVPVDSATHILIKDPADERDMRNWSLEDNDVVVISRVDCTLEQVREELDAMLLAVRLDGIPIGNLTERTWLSSSPPQKGAKVKTPKVHYFNAKHKQHTFQMVGTHSTGILSSNWEKTTPPQEEHCYFIIHGFQFRDSTEFYRIVQNDQALAKAFGLTFPTIYGYKNTVARPIADADIENGTPYLTWRETFFKVLMTPERQQEIRDLNWFRLFNAMYYIYTRRDEKNFQRNLPKFTEQLAQALGEKHSVVRYFKRYQEGAKAAEKFKRSYVTLLDALVVMFPSRNKRNAPQCALDRMLATYPMLSLSVTDDNDMHVFRTHTETLINYILLIDGGSTPDTQA